MLMSAWFVVPRPSLFMSLIPVGSKSFSRSRTSYLLFPNVRNTNGAEAVEATEAIEAVTYSTSRLTSPGVEMVT